MEPVVDADHGCLRAGTQAGVVLQGNAVICRLALAGQACVLEDTLQNGGRADQVTCGAPANLDGVLRGRRKTEVSVEGGHPPNVVDAGVVVGRDLLDGLYAMGNSMWLKEL